MKKIKLCFVLVIVLLLISVFFVACKDNNKFVPEELGSKGLLFSYIDEGINEGGYSVSLGACESEDVVIPATYNYKPVKQVEISGDNSKNVTNISIPDSVVNVSVDSNSPWYKNQPDGVLYLGNVAFGYKGIMPDKTYIFLKEGTTAISDGAFAGFGALSGVYIPQSVKYAGKGFLDETGWYKEQPNGVVYAGRFLYKYKGKMPDNRVITIKEGTIGICYMAFGECHTLTGVSIPNSVEYIDVDAFFLCDGLKSVIIPESVTFVGRFAFAGCLNLRSVVIKNKDLKVQQNAFHGCSALENVSVPDGFMDIYEVACVRSSSKTITVWYDSQNDGVVYVGKVASIYKGSPIDKLKIENGTIGIGNKAFEGVDMKSIMLPDSVEAIGNYAFYACSDLVNITLSNNLKSIGEHAFSWCTSLEEIKIPSGVTIIDCNSFEFCRNLTSVEIPNSVQAICKYAFWGCKSLTKIKIPKGVIRISKGAFDSCISLNNIEIPNSVKVIETGAFADCDSLTTIKFRGTKRQWKQISFDFEDSGLPQPCKIVCIDGTITVGQ